MQSSIINAAIANSAPFARRTVIIDQSLQAGLSKRERTLAGWRKRVKLQRLELDIDCPNPTE
jgi:hypothetical protein